MVAFSSRRTLKGNSHQKQCTGHLYRYLPKIIVVFGIVVMGMFQWSLSRSLAKAPQPRPVVHEASTPKYDEPRTEMLPVTMESLRKAPTKNIASNTNDIKVSNVMQVSHATGKNRYPDEYAAVQSYLRTQFPEKPLKLMSFGSSYGDEAISLATLYFNETEGFSDVTIYGFDVDDDTLIRAREYVDNYAHNAKRSPLPIQFFDGRNTSLNIDGTYDAIFANSVLCDATSQPMTVEVVEKQIPFEYFESTLAKFDDLLNERGVIAIVQSSYLFKDSHLAERYEVVSQCVSNLIPYIDLEKHTFVPNPNNEARDCVWKKLRSA